VTTIRVSTRRYSFHIVREAEVANPTGECISCPREAVEIAKHVIGEQITECLIAIFVDARHRVTGYTEIARGTLNATRFTPRDVLVPALHASAGGIIVAHNHPSGAVEPSRADRQVTVALRDACAMIGIPLLDHIIVTESAYHSFRETECWQQ
jgi:DNA repair protein RadC